MKRLGLLLLSLLLAAPQMGRAESLRDDPKSIYAFHPYIDGAIIGVTGLGSTLAYVFENRLIVKRCPCNPAEVNGFDRSAIGNHSDVADRVSDITVGLSIVGPPLVSLLDVGWNSVLLEDALIYAEVFAVNAAIVTATKTIFQRPIPRTYEGVDTELLTSANGYRSFYSGHTSAALSMLTAFAMTYTYRHGLVAWPWILAGAAGTSVAIERVLAGRHFYTDVIVGAIAGAGVGYLIPMLHRRDSEAERVWIAPVESGGIAVTWMGRF